MTRPSAATITVSARRVIVKDVGAAPAQSAAEPEWSEQTAAGHQPTLQGQRPCWPHPQRSVAFLGRSLNPEVRVEVVRLFFEHLFQETRVRVGRCCALERVGKLSAQ